METHLSRVFQILKWYNKAVNEEPDKNEILAFEWGAEK
jgi:hypothetical protein